MKPSENPLGSEPVSSLLRRFAIPSVIAMLVSALYNMVDQLFIGHSIGVLGNAATNVAFPLSMVCTSIGLLCGIGGAANFNLCMGRKDPEHAKSYVGNAISMLAILGVILCVAVQLFLRPMMLLFGATPDVIDYACTYTRITSIGFPFLIVTIGGSNLIRADGSPKVASAATLAGAILYTILDPVFIFVCRWGMMGAAVATVLGQIVTAVLAIWYLCNMRVIRPGKGDFKLSGGLCRRILSLGMTSFLSQISLVAAMAAINNMLRKYGALDPIFGQAQYAQIPMAVVGIVMKFFQIVISIVVGMAAGCIPIVGFNMGAEKFRRVNKLFTMLLISEAAVGAVALILVEFFPQQLISLFGAANESAFYTEFAVKAFRIYLCMMIPACVNKACFIFLQALGKALSSTVLSMLREVVFGVGFAILLPIWFGLDGVLYSMPVSDILTFVVSVVLILGTYRELNSKAQ